MSRKTRQRGSALLEFGLVAPVLMLLSLVAIDTARAFRFAMANSSAVRAGIHHASLSEANAVDTAGIEAAARRNAGGSASLQLTTTRFCTCSSGGAEVSCTTTCSTKMEYLRLRGQMPFRPVVPLQGVIGDLTLRDTAVMRIK